MSENKTIGNGDWSEPDALPDPLLNVMPYQSDLLPPSIGTAVDDIAERMQCPPDFPAAAMLVALAAVIGCRIGVRPRQCDDWLVIPNLWGCVVGRPSLKKTPAISHAEKRIRAIEARERERLGELIVNHDVDVILSESNLKAIKRKIDAAVKTGDVDEARRLALEIKAIQDATPPVPRRIITSNTTIEKLGDMLNTHPAGMLMWVDELVGWMRGLDRQDMAGVRQQYLTLWNGIGRLNIDRVGRGEMVVDHPCLSVFGCATPGGLSDYIAAAVRGGRGDDGLVQRLQILVWPDSPKEYRLVDRWLDSAARLALACVFEDLADIDPIEFADRDGFDDRGVPWLRFDAEGQAAFDSWDLSIQNRIRSGELPESFESHLSKYSSMVPSIALVLHLAIGGRGPVDGESVRLAIRWADYLETHAARLYSVAVAPERRLAKPLLRRLIDWPQDKPIRVRSIAEKGWSGLDDAEAVADVLELLVDAGWLRAQPVVPTSGGRPTTDFLVHPRAVDYLKSPKSDTLKTHKIPEVGSFEGFEGEDSGALNQKASEPSGRKRGVI
jgi:hypothetical protein